MHQSKSYSDIAFAGVLWNIIFAFMNKGVTLVGQLVLAWYLIPKDMGLAGMATAMVGLVAFLSSGRLGSVLVQRGRYKSEVGQAFWLGGIMSVFLAMVIVILSKLSYIAGKNEISDLMLILAFGTLISAPNAVLGAGLMANHDFKGLAFCNMIEGMTFTISAIILARFGMGPYSLVLPVIPQALVGTFYYIWREGFPPIEMPKMSIMAALFRPTFTLALTGMLIGLQTQSAVFFVGLTLDSSQVGYFSWGWSVASQIVFLLAVNLNQVFLPIFSKLFSEPNRQIDAVLKTAWVLTFVLSILCISQAWLVRPLLTLFMNGKWNDASDTIEIASIGLIFQGTWIPVTVWLNASGKYRELLVANTFSALMISGLAYLGARIGTIAWAATGVSLGMFLSTVFVLHYIPLPKARRFVISVLAPLAIFFLSFIQAKFVLQHVKSPIWIFSGMFVLIAIGMVAWMVSDKEGIIATLFKGTSRVLSIK